MNAGPRWTLRIGAVLMALAPLLDDIRDGVFSGPGAFRPFSASWRLGDSLGLDGWRLCWILPLLASFPRLRTSAAAGWLGLTAALGLFWCAMAALPDITYGAPVGCLYFLLGQAALLLLVGLTLARVAVQTISAWSRILLAAAVALLASAELYGRAFGMSAAGAWMLALAGAICLAGEVWALASTPQVDEQPAEPGS